MSAVDQFSGRVDVKIVVGRFIAQGDGRLASVMEGVFLADDGERLDKNIKSMIEWCDIGIETRKESQELLKWKLTEAQCN